MPLNHPYIPASRASCRRAQLQKYFQELYDSPSRLRLTARYKNLDVRKGAGDSCGSSVRVSKENIRNKNGRAKFQNSARRSIPAADSGCPFWERPGRSGILRGPGELEVDVFRGVSDVYPSYSRTGVLHPDSHVSGRTQRRFDLIGPLDYHHGLRIAEIIEAEHLELGD